jgi:hypothetical protein
MYEVLGVEIMGHNSAHFLRNVRRKIWTVQTPRVQESDIDVNSFVEC